MLDTATVLFAAQDVRRNHRNTAALETMDRFPLTASNAYGFGPAVQQYFTGRNDPSAQALERAAALGGNWPHRINLPDEAAP